MSACFHGLPATMCAVCNKVVLVRDAFSPRRVEEDEPRLRKSRGKSEWVGVGRSTGDAGDVVGEVGLYKGSCVRSTGSTAWGQENAMRTAFDVLAKLRRG